MNDRDRSSFRIVRGLVVLLLLVFFFLFFNPVKVIPAGHVGVKDFFGIVSPSVHVLLQTDGDLVLDGEVEKQVHPNGLAVSARTRRIS